METAGWPVEHLKEAYPKWDPAAQKYRAVSVERRKAALTWHSLRHRFARTCVDILRMPEGELMAIGGWENIGTVQTRYYRSGRDNMERGLSYFD
jgi:integrase